LWVRSSAAELSLSLRDAASEHVLPGSSACTRRTRLVSIRLGHVRDWTQDLYAERVRRSIDLVVFFTLQLGMVFEGIRSERRVTATASLSCLRFRMGGVNT
jgi:hypothetical protein